LQLIIGEEHSICKNFSRKDKIYGLFVDDVASSTLFVGNKFFNAIGKLFAKKLTKFNPFNEHSELVDLLSKMLNPNPNNRANLSDLLQESKWLQDDNGGGRGKV